MSKFEQLYKLIGKYYWVLLAVLLIVPNFLQPTWFWRWFAILLLSAVFIAIFLWGYYAWLVLKREPISLTTTSKQQLENINPSQKKWHTGLFYFGMFVVAPLLIYMSTLPLVDTARSLFADNYVQTAVVTIEDRSTFAGTWFVGQSLQIEEENISDGNLLLLFSLEHALEGKQYEARYLPFSGLVLEMNEVKK